MSTKVSFESVIDRNLTYVFLVLGNGLNSRYELTWVRRGWISIRHETSERFLRSVKRSWFLKGKQQLHSYNED